MKLKDMNFTKKTLTITKACQDAIDFCERNELFIETPIKDLKISGPYRGWKQWLEYRLENEYEYDSSGNLVKETFPNGDTRKYEYDSSGNLVKETDFRGRTREYEHIKNNNTFTVLCNNKEVLRIKYPNRRLSHGNN